MKIDKRLRQVVDILLSKADSDAALTDFYNDTVSFEKLFLSVSGLRKLALSEQIANEKKKEVLKNLFEGRFSPYFLAFLYLLVDLNRLNKAPAAVHYARVRAERLLRKRKAEVITAVEVDRDFREKIEKLVKKISEETAVIEFKNDPEIIGGVILRVGDKLIDASIRGRLNRFKESLMTRL